MSADDFAERVNKRVEALGLKPVDLAAATRVHQSAAERWLKGLTKPHADHIAPLAKTLGVSVSWLLTGEEEAFDEQTRASIWEGLQGALDRLAVLRQKKMTEAVRSQIEEVEQGITLAQQLLGLTGGQAAALSEAAAASSEAESLRVDAPDEDPPEPEEVDPPTRPSA